ncbi:hypothetical protein [Actinoallomurus sp. NPDC050550]|uniref:hypothetical protein n=1 Tax=Actinoallomurus sp. NPDC050550 TaxID=3154937 RepID=UPI003401E346
MKRIWWAAVVLLLAGCGVQPSGVTDAGQAPTGVAPGMTLYFVDAHQRLRPQLRPSGHLGTISEAMSWLLAGPGGSNLHTGIASNSTTQVVVTTTPGVIRLRVPLAIYEVTPLGIDQIVCTALGVNVQSGGSRTMKVQVIFTTATSESAKQRTCPLIR